MSIKIGIVCEGISDYRVLKHITERYLRDIDVYTIPLKPKEKRIGKQDGFGGWNGVLEYISGSDKMILEAINEGCEYVIIHIDTDVRNEYGLNSDYISQEQLHADVATMISEHIHPGFDKSKIIFAIAIHETECWLIPFICDSTKECIKTDSCVATLNKLLKGNGFIDKDNKNAEKAKSTYDRILRMKRKAKEIRMASKFNFGFAHFISTLDTIKDIHAHQD